MFKGLMPALVTLFDERGELDFRATEAIVERHIAARVDGIVALGSTGEFSHLEGDERRYFVEEIARVINGRVPLIIGVGSSGTREAISLARHAEEAGADAVIAVSPFYWKVGEEALFRHFATVSESISIPTLIYNFPMLTGIDLSPALVRRVAEECPNVAGIKDTVQVYLHTVNVIREAKSARPDFAVLTGFEDQILPALLAGADGSICGLSNVAPELFVSLVRAFESGDLEEAAGLHRRVLSLMALGAQSDPPIGAMKFAMNMLGVPISPTVRGPGLPAADEESVENILKEASLLGAPKEA